MFGSKLTCQSLSLSLFLSHTRRGDWRSHTTTETQAPLVLIMHHREMRTRLVWYRRGAFFSFVWSAEELILTFSRQAQVRKNRKEVLLVRTFLTPPGPGDRGRRLIDLDCPPPLLLRPTLLFGNGANNLTAAKRRKRRGYRGRKEEEQKRKGEKALMSLSVWKAEKS